MVLACLTCGHVFNELDENDYIDLVKYYSREYSLINLGSPGSIESRDRYMFLFDFIENYLKLDPTILDIGCATGGFLRYLRTRGYTRLHGIDIADPYVKKAMEDEDLMIEHGSSWSIPYGDDYFDFIMADQVLEHLYNPNEIFVEAKRVLKKGGLLCVSVPDAMRYNEHFFFDFYWFLIREHIQHFDFEHLIKLAKNHGFSLVDGLTSVTSMVGDKAMLPGINMIFKNGGDNSVLVTRSFNLRERMLEYIERCKQELASRQRFLEFIGSSSQPVYVFGVSREFLYLYRNTCLNKHNIAKLIDDTPFKQTATVDGRSIEGRHALEGSKGHVLVTATAHTEKIKQAVKELGFKGDIIEL
jgi:SAM-dependent methyltransferase